VISEDGGLVVWDLLYGPLTSGSSDCIYRASDGALVGVSIADEVAEFCNGTSYVESAGMQVPSGVQGTAVSCAPGVFAVDAASDATADSGSDSGD
jgi:hypothetical protein